MTKLQGLLDEANCVQHSVIAMIENLQKNPDALAAVALTLGEISNIASKMAPGMITAMKGSFPAVIALLASPEFLIAAGVGVGVTIIMLGGYKIIKKIKERNDDGPMLEQAAPLPAPPRQAEIAESAADEEEEFDELREIDSELSRIEVWRRGIADAEEASMGTSVEGEFITPGATRTLIEEGVMREDDLKSTRTGRTSRTKKSSRSSRHHHGDSHSSTTTKEKSRKSSTKKKEPSGLRMLFKSHA
ncbi:hypothetical protein AAFC00_004205 [Neodothiora populina]|uniref:Uncharacterized protein n=1 Tax=Neodothiora populina TaxID=2781224 RepID=A0ABR3PK05_9PEZI